MSKKRKPLDRIRWGWAENYTPGCVTENDMKTVYRLLLKQHKPSTCSKNCLGNPNCVSGFGERVWNQTIDRESELETYISSRQRNGTYVGLKNLGNTCYINSLLQLWFHNIPFREAFYGWNALEDKYEIEKHLEKYNRPIDINNYQPLTCIAHLQYLFAEMQFGLTKSCDPEAFCQSLNIDVEIQQDAQEFSKLYMQRLEESFRSSSNPKTSQIIQTQFRGEYSYVTTCGSCPYESNRRSYFYELELKVKNCNSILDSLQEFLSEEQLTGDNQYFCSNCNGKQDAITRIKLQQLPPVLQLHLLRYEIDAVVGNRRKIHSAIQFPDILDMSGYMSAPPETYLYKLNAVIMHGGSSASSGHYYAHINTADGWYIFDDATVKKQKQLNLAYGEVTSSTEKKFCGPKLKGFRSSTRVYMLVYVRVENDSEGNFVTKQSAKNGKSADDSSKSNSAKKSEGSGGMNQHAEEADGELRNSGPETRNARRRKCKTIEKRKEKFEENGFDDENKENEKFVFRNIAETCAEISDESMQSNPNGVILETDNDERPLEIKREVIEDIIGVSMKSCMSQNEDFRSSADRDNSDQTTKIECNGIDSHSNRSNSSEDENKRQSPAFEVNQTENSDDGTNDVTAIVYGAEDGDLENKTFSLNWLMKEIKDGKSIVENKPKVNSENLIWVNFWNSETFGSIYVVCDKKFLNYPFQKNKSTEEINEFENRGRKRNNRVNGKSLNRTVSPTPSSKECKNCEIPSECKIMTRIEETNGGSIPNCDDVKERSRSNSESQNEPNRSEEMNDSMETRGVGGADEGGGGGGDEGGGGGDSDEDGGENSKKSGSLDGTPDLRNELDAAHWDMLHEYLKSAIIKSRIAFKQSFESEQNDINVRIDIQNLMKTIIETFAQETNEEEYEFINFEWLRSITKSPSTPIDNSPLLCKHRKLSFNKTCSYKAISTGVADILYEKFGGGPRLKSDSLCRQCVENQARKYKLSMEVTKDDKTMSVLTKQLIEDRHEAYWVGKKSLINWKNLVLQESFDSEIDEEEETENSKNSPQSSEKVESEKKKEDLESTKIEMDGEVSLGNKSFNEDIVCVHGNLTADANDRKLVPEAAWSILYKYFPNCRVFPRHHSPCVPCQNLASQDKLHRDSVRERGLNEKELLKEVFERKPTWDIVTVGSYCYLVDSAFTVKWKRFVRSVTRTAVIDPPLPEEMIFPLLCEAHSLLLYDPNVDIDRFFLLNLHEWQFLKSVYPSNLELKVTKSETQELVTSIDLCKDCVQERRHAEAEESLENSYNNATIYVYKLNNNVEGDGDSEDNEQEPVKTGTKKRKLNNNKAKVTFSAPVKNSKVDVGDFRTEIRRSERARNLHKDRKAIPIHKFMTLKELKKKICAEFGVPASDQHLSVNGIDLDALAESCDLSETEATLMRLKIQPNSVVELKADEPYTDGNMPIDEGYMQPEAGFKGTELGGR